MRKLKHIFTAILCLAALLTVAGCGGQGIKTEYYSLNPILAQPALNIAPLADFSRYTLALGPVNMPAYITGRPQIVAQADVNKLEVMEYARWAEPPDTNIMLVLTDNLAYLLNCGNIVQYPWRASTTFDYRAELTIFTMTADTEKATLRGRYRLSATAGGNARDAEFAYNENLQAFTPGDIVAAYNKMLDELSLELAGKLVELRAGNNY